MEIRIAMQGDSDSVHYSHQITSVDFFKTKVMTGQYLKVQGKNEPPELAKSLSPRCHLLRLRHSHVRSCSLARIFTQSSVTLGREKSGGLWHGSRLSLNSSCWKHVTMPEGPNCATKSRKS